MSGAAIYAYVDGNPISFADPEGLEKVPVFGPMVPHSTGPVPDDPVFKQRTDGYADQSGTYMIYGHGYQGGIWNGVRNEWVTTPDQLAALLKRHGWKPGQPVVIYACRTGLKQDNGQPSIAEQFANKYKTKTTAPTRQLWYDQNPSTGPTLIYGKDPAGNMNKNDPGTMVTYPIR